MNKANIYSAVLIVVALVAGILVGETGVKFGHCGCKSCSCYGIYFKDCNCCPLVKPKPHNPGQVGDQ